jgi:predicted ATPase
VKIKKLYIENFKSLIDIEIIEPNPFTVFVGPNGSGKSNTFEAIQLASLPKKFNSTPGSYKEWIKVFGGYESIRPKLEHDGALIIGFEDDADNRFIFVDSYDNNKIADAFKNGVAFEIKNIPDDAFSLLRNCSRISIGKSSVNKVPESPSELLESDGSNLENIIKKIFEDKTAKDEIIEWMQVFVPEFANIEVQVSALSGNSEIAIFEKKLNQPLSRNLISDGTYNILSLLALIYQDKEPQFLLVEEPENGLHPYVIKELVNFFRQQCEERGHYIWLNTHSQTLVDELKPHEIILVDKKNGSTEMKQLAKDKNLHGLKMDFAWLSNALGGGVPW